MALEGVNRYAEIIKSMTGGPFYDANGTIIPYRSGNTDLRLKSDAPNTEYGIFINEFFSGTVVSDDNGNVEFSRFLNFGQNVVVLINNVSGNRFTTWLNVRDSALWQIAYAETMEWLDDDYQTTKDNLSIETAHPDGLVELFGDPIGVYNNQGLDTDSYRWQLQELRTAFRDYGGKFRGVETAVAEFTQIPPFGYSRRMWGPNWILDQQMLANSRFLDRSAEYTYVSNDISGVTIQSFESDVPSGVGVMRMFYNPTTNTLMWGVSPGDFGELVHAGNGDLFLPGPPSDQDPFILGDKSTFSFLPLGQKQYFYFSLEGQPYKIDLSGATGYPTPSLSDLVNHINAEYQTITGGVDTVVAAYNGRLLFTHESDFIQVESGYLRLDSGGSVIQVPDSNAAVALFGVRVGDLHFNKWIDDVPGVELLSIEGDIDTYVDSVIEYNSTQVALRWGSPGGAPAVWVPITGDGNYTLVDNLGHSLKVHVFMDYLKYEADAIGVLTDTLRGNVSASFDVDYMRVARRVMQTKGVHVLVNQDLLPTNPTSALVTIIDDSSSGENPSGTYPAGTYPEEPDRWWLEAWTAGPGGTVTEFEPSVVINDKNEELDPSAAFRYKVTEPAGGLSETTIYGRVLKYPVSEFVTGPSYPQRDPALFYDYEGFSATFSGWFLSHTTEDVDVTLGFSFDAGATWVDGSTVTIPGDAGGLGLEGAIYVEVDATIPANLTPNGVWVRAHCIQASGPISVSIDGADVDVHRITSRILGNVTVPRIRHRQWFGELMFVWSPGLMSTVEQQYIGVIYKNPSVTNPFAGVLIQSISNDTPPGKGVIEYQFNASGDIHKLRWTAYGTTWAPGAGWVNVLSDGVKVLEAPDGSFVEVYVTYGLLPILTGTPPAASVSKDVSISDISTYQGIVRDISPAHSSLDIVDVSEYGPDGRISNVKGAITEDDFVECDLVNLTINDGSLYTSPPFKDSFLNPSIVLNDVEGEVLSVSLVAPHVAQLQKESDQVQLETLLFEDGIVMPNTTWQFNASNQIQILDFSLNSQYTINYRPMYVVTTPYLELGDNFQDYVWFSDYMLWNRMEHNPLTREAEVPVYFSQDSGKASLKYPSDMDKSKATMYYDSDEGRVEIPKLNWYFLNPFEVKMDSSQYIQGNQYFITHQEVRVYPQSALTLTFEHRSGVTALDCESAPWVPTDRNRNVSVHQSSGGHSVHQLRLSVSGARDIKDFRIRSVVLKGLHIRGTGASVGGLTNV